MVVLTIPNRTGLNALLVIQMIVKAPNMNSRQTTLLDTFAGSIWVDVERYHGQWIAIIEDQVVGNDSDLEELMKDTERHFTDAEYQYISVRRAAQARK